MNYQTLSADMRRVAWWLQRGDRLLADRFIELNYRRFLKDQLEVGGRKLNWWLEVIRDNKENMERRAERALTLSLMLRNLS